MTRPDRYRGPVLVIVTVLAVMSSFATVGSTALGPATPEMQSVTDSPHPPSRQVLGATKTTAPTEVDSWPMGGGNAANTNHIDTTGPTKPITARWKFAPDDAEDITGAVVHRGTVYFGVSQFDNQESAVYAVDAWTGEVQWKFSQLDGPKTPAVFKDTVYVVGHGGQMWALEAETGKVFWEIKLGKPARAPVVANRTVYVTGSTGTGSLPDGRIYALNALNGDVRWTFTTEGPASSPTVRDGTIYVGARYGKLYALEDKTGDERWNVVVNDGERLRQPSIARDTVYVGGAHGNVYAVDAATGEDRWHRKIEGSRGVSSPSVAGNTVYFGTKRDKLYAVAAQTGETSWSVTKPNNRPAVVNGTVYSGQGASMYALNAPSGNTQAAFSVENSSAHVSSSPAVVKGSLYTAYGFGSEDGGSERTTLYALGSPDIHFENLNVSKRNVKIEEPLKVTVTVSNTGTGPGSYDTSMTINGEVGATKSGSLEAGEQTTLSFTLKFPETGTYTVEVGGISQEIGVGSDASVPTETTSRSDTDDSTPGDTTTAGGSDSTPTETPTSSTTPGFGVTVGLVAVSIVMVLLTHGRRT